jgi:hypothetical protein
MPIAGAKMKASGKAMESACWWTLAEFDARLICV